MDYKCGEDFEIILAAFVINTGLICSWQHEDYCHVLGYFFLRGLVLNGPPRTSRELQIALYSTRPTPTEVMV